MAALINNQSINNPQPISNDLSMMPDLSHLSAEEREIIEGVLQRQQQEQAQHNAVTQTADRELEELEYEIKQRQNRASRDPTSGSDGCGGQLCQVCERTKFADGIGHKCHYCHLRSCVRCGGRTQGKLKNRFQTVWACLLCQKRQQLMAKTGRWFHGTEAHSNISSPTSAGAEAAVHNNHDQSFANQSSGQLPSQRGLYQNQQNAIDCGSDYSVQNMRSNHYVPVDGNHLLGGPNQLMMNSHSANPLTSDSNFGHSQKTDTKNWVQEQNQQLQIQNNAHHHRPSHLPGITPSPKPLAPTHYPSSTNQSSPKILAPHQLPNA